MTRLVVSLLVAVGFFAATARGLDFRSARNDVSGIFQKAPNSVDHPENTIQYISQKASPLAFYCEHDGIFPHPENCRRYLKCKNGGQYELSCPDHQHFDNVTLQCVDPCEAHCDRAIACDCGWDSCGEDSARVPRNRCSRDGLYADPADCGHYVRCSEGTAHVMPCPQGLHFSPQTRRCESPCVAQCDPTVSCKWKSATHEKGAVTPTWSVLLCIEESDEPFPNPDDCGTYINCSSFRGQHAVACPEGQHFSPSNRSCQSPCDARCNMSMAAECGWDDVTTLDPEIDVCSQPPYRPAPHNPNCLGVAVRRFTYMANWGICKFIMYKGCPPNTTNLFLTNTECEARCMPEGGDYLQKSKLDFECFRDGLFPNPQNCATYIQCFKGASYVMPCPEGLHFSEEDLQCEVPCDAHCLFDECDWGEENPNKVDMSPKYPTFAAPFEYRCVRDGLYPNPNSCATYIRCDAGNALLLECPGDKHFRQETQRCESACDARCNPTIAEECGWERRDYAVAEQDVICIKSALHSNPRNCSTYVQCAGGQSYVMPCPRGLHFSLETQRCERPCQARCDASFAKKCGWKEGEYIQKKPQYDHLCSRGGVVFPEVCTSYIQCSAGQAYGIPCPSGLHFSTLTMRCEMPCDAYCDPDLAEVCSWEQKSYSLKQPIFDFRCMRNGLIENDADCGTFIQCTGGVAYLISCPVGLHFNPVDQKCQTPCEARCQPGIEEKCYKDQMLPNSPLRQVIDGGRCFGQGLYANENDCNSFIECRNSVAHVLACPVGLHFNGGTEKCEPPCVALCDPTVERCKRSIRVNGIRSPTLKSKQPLDCARDGLYTDARDCGRYIECSAGHSYVVQCPAGLHFGSEAGKCVPPCDAHCNVTLADSCGWNLRDYAERLPEYDFSCSINGVYYDGECTGYVQCFEGEAYFVDCPAGLHFSPYTHQCKPPCQAYCDLNDEALVESCGWNPVGSSTPGDVGYVSSDFSTRDYDLSEIPDVECPEDMVWGLSGNCNLYLECLNTKAHVRRCPPGKHFSKQTLACESPCDARCNKSLACECGWKECNGKVTEEIDCEVEYETGPCRGNFTRYYYDVDSGRCRRFTYGGCGGNGNNFETETECRTQCQQKLLEGFRCPDKNGKFGHFSDCTSYYECKRDIPTLRRCPKGTAFDHLKEKCVTEYKATCVYRCPDPDAVYPYEKDCHKYIDCVNGISKLEKCPPGTAFDPKERNCVEADKVSCVPGDRKQNSLSIDDPLKSMAAQKSIPSEDNKS